MDDQASLREWLRAAVAKRGARIKASKSIGSDPSVITKLLNGTRRFQVGEPRKIAEALGIAPPSAVNHEHIDSSEILGEISGTQASVRVVGYVGANSQEHRYSVGETDLEVVPAPPGATDKTVALEIRGVSLGKPFDRWLVFYDDVRSPVTDDLIGELCVVGLADDRVLVKKLLRTKGKSNLFDLVSLNEDDVLSGQKVAWAAMVVALSRKR